MSIATDIASGMSKIKSDAAAGVSKISQPIAGVVDAVDSVLEQIPASLVVFASPKVPVPVAAIPVMFNPEKLKFSKKAHWHTTKTAKRKAPTARFSGGEGETYTLTLFLDSSKAGVLGVSGYIFILRQLMNPPLGLLDQPPLVKFVWGLTNTAMAYIQQLDYEYTLFTPGGRPLRAEVTLTLKEYGMGFLELLLQNPTSRSEARKTWVVTEGQTLDWIAYQEYGDPSAWRHIAKVNHLMNPLELKPGQILKLTPLE